MKKGAKITVHCFKNNGQCYRSYEFPKILEQTNEYICLSLTNVHVLSIKKNSKGRETCVWSKLKYQCIWYLFFNKWYNIIFYKKKNKNGAYINLATPIIAKDDVISFIDYDYDYRICNINEKNQRIVLLDEHEYNQNKTTYNYSQQIQDKILQTKEALYLLYTEEKLDKYFNFKLLNDEKLI